MRFLLRTIITASMAANMILAGIAYAETPSPSLPSQTAFEYGQECAAKVSPVPAFSCMDGKLIPITVNGKTPAAYTPQMQCDKPSLLVEDASQKTDGQCVPYSRVLLLRDDDVAQVSALCRQKKIRPSDTTLFDEIDIVAHNVRSGSTCWFQAVAALPLSPTTGIDGRRISSATQAAAGSIWNPPSVTASGQCVACHDSGPFMYSPFIAQTSLVPGDPFGKYKNDIGADFKRWQQPHGITTRGNTCTTCHRIGNLNSCHVALRQSTGKLASPGQDEAAKKYPLSHWMAPGNLHSKAQWDQIFLESANKLSACCENPNGVGCEVVDYNGVKAR
jgi:hypothetical protein